MWSEGQLLDILFKPYHYLLFLNDLQMCLVTFEIYSSPTSMTKIGKTICTCSLIDLLRTMAQSSRAKSQKLKIYVATPLLGKHFKVYKKLSFKHTFVQVMLHKDMACKGL